MPEPINKKKWAEAKAAADTVYARHSAYKSGYIIKKYKELGGTFRDDDKPKLLKRWFQEEWTNQRGETGYKYKSDVYRPRKRITKNTPITWDELPKGIIEKAKRSKSQGKRALFKRAK